MSNAPTAALVAAAIAATSVYVDSRSEAFGGEAAAHSGNPLQMAPLSALTETQARPLFSASRRPLAIVRTASPAPAPPPAAPVAPDPPEAPPFALAGTIVNATTGIALLKNPSTDAVRGLRVGEQDLGWRVRSVAARSIVVEKGAQSVTLAFPTPQHPSDGQTAAAVSPNKGKRDH